MAGTPTPSPKPQRSEADIYGRASVGLGAASIFSILLPTFPLILGCAALYAAFTARSSRRKAGEEPGPESHGFVMGTIGVVVGLMMLGFYAYAATKLRGS